MDNPKFWADAVNPITWLDGDSLPAASKVTTYLSAANVTILAWEPVGVLTFSIAVPTSVPSDNCNCPLITNASVLGFQTNFVPNENWEPEST